MSSLSLSHLQMLGCNEAHLSPIVEQENIYVHGEILSSLRQLTKDANAAGFDLKVASGFRSFERQLLIWNNKCSGNRAIMDEQGLALDIAGLSTKEKVYAICRWSALPGASRHHWGTDIDIYDAKVMSEDYQLQLQPSEYEANGLFSPMMEWLDVYLSLPSSPHFFKPYQLDKGGIAPEPWHLSYQPIADHYEQQLSLEVLHTLLSSISSALVASDGLFDDVVIDDEGVLLSSVLGHYTLEDKVAVLEYLPDLYRRFVQR
ncbi:M15 family metallopeptidase [Eionea flava]